MAWPTWRQAMEHALYGPEGFFRRERPIDHFRTSVHAGELFAMAIGRLADECGVRTVIDIGAGRGELLAALAKDRPELDLLAVELAARPPGLPAAIGWFSELPVGIGPALVIANEWLDNIPVEVIEVDGDGRPRIVHVDPVTGTETLGDPVGGADAEWLATWWPLRGAEPGFRAEVGRARDSAWAGVVTNVRRSVLVAIDYSHTRGDRPPFGSLAAYQDGRSVRPVPDGMRDLTAHVALDSCAAAGEAAGATGTVLTTQRQALRRLGIDAGLPPRRLATSDPPAYVEALGRTSQAAELVDSAGLGGFTWLVQAVGTQVPAALASLGR
ncbi:MAG TPA: SAM-dependent methyltransferase [Jiangellaceae bacterium]